MQDHKKLLSSTRNNYPDCIYFGSYYVADFNKIIISYGQKENTICYMRSLAKPLQASIVFDFDIDFTEEELAIFSGSHSGSPKHIELLKNTMKKYNIKDDDLMIEQLEPLDKRDFKGRPTKLHNNCSGKHLMMAILTKHLKYDKNYLHPNHPIQKIIKTKQEELSEYKSELLTYDGCGTPLWGLPYKNIIKAYFNIFHDKKYSYLVSSIINNPEIFGGYTRQDSDIIKNSHNTLFSKVGASGLILVYNFKEDKIVLLKMSSDNNSAREQVIYGILRKLNWINYKPDVNIYNQKGDVVAKYLLEF